MAESFAATAAAVSAWLTSNGLNFNTSTFAPHREVRTWSLTMRETDEAPPLRITIQLTGSLLCGATPLSVGRNVDLHEVVAFIMTNFAFVRGVEEQADEGRLIWLRAEFPVDTDNAPHVLPGTILASVGSVFEAAKQLVRSFAGRLEFADPAHVTLRLPKGAVAVDPPDLKGLDPRQKPAAR